MNKSLLIKSIIYRPYSEFITFLIAWAITGQIKLSIAIGLANLVLKIGSYLIYDLFWNKYILIHYPPSVIWLTGLSGSGKTSIADALFKKLKSQNAKCILLDGDEIRKILPRMGFDKEARVKHNINVGYMASVFEKQGYVVIVSLVSPFKEGRDACRELATNFKEIYVNTPLEICETRDRKGLYKKARNNEITDFTGVSSPYEAPVSPELCLDTNLIDIDTCVSKIQKIIR